MAIKLIAMDVDGTLLNQEGEVTKEVKEAFQEADRAGIKLALATGRVRAECIPLLMRLPEIRYTVNCTGASVYDLDREKEIFANSIPMEIVREVYIRLYDISCQFEVMADGVVYCDAKKFGPMTASYPDGHLEYYMQTLRTTRTAVNLERLLRQRQLPVSKLHMFFRNPKASLWAERQLQDMDLLVLRSVPENLEVNMPDVDKGVGLRALAEYLELKPEEVMAIGDNLNDAGMLRYAGYPTLVANCNPSVLPLGKYMTASNEESGVAKAIRAALEGRMERLRICGEGRE